MSMSKYKQAIIFGSLLATTITLNAFAFDLDEVQNGTRPYQEEFKALDKNNSSTLTWAEVKQDKNVSKQDVKAFDHDKDGTLSYEEFAELKTQSSQKAIKGAMSDSWITTKVKAKLLEEESLKSLKISVETHNGEVLLSGFVGDASLKTRAEQVVSAVEGVKSVKNAIVVKS